MKTLFFSTIFSIAVTLCMGQGAFQVNWNTSSTCEQNISLVGQAPDNVSTFTTGDVHSNDQIKISVTFRKNEVKSLTYFVNENDSIRPIIKSAEEAGMTSERTSQDFEIRSGQLHPGFTGTLVYPFKLELTYEDNRKCTLTLGKPGGEITTPTPTSVSVVPTSNINILRNIHYNHIGKPSLDPTSWPLAKKNAIIVLDCAPFTSAESMVYRKGKKGEAKTVESFWVGDYVKIYLINFNPYFYKVEIDNQQQDIYNSAQVNTTPYTKPDNNGTNTNSGLVDSSSDAKAKLAAYAQAVAQMDTFINQVKTNRMPDSWQLEENKRIIQRNLHTVGLIKPGEIDSLYKSLLPNEKTSMKTTYQQALRFAPTLAVLQALTYTIETAILPIQIHSFDKITFTVTLKDKKTGAEIKKQEYSYLIKGGLKVDQSYGIVSHKLMDEQYALKSVTVRDTTFAPYPNQGDIVSVSDVTKKQIITDESPAKISIGATTLTHLYYRLGQVGIGPSVGLTIDVYPQQKIRYMMGGSLMFRDERHRISLDAGWLFGKYSTLSNTQHVGDLLDGADAQPTLVEKNGKSLYIGISYNVPIIPKDTQKAKPD